MRLPLSRTSTSLRLSLLLRLILRSDLWIIQLPVQLVKPVVLRLAVTKEVKPDKRMADAVNKLPAKLCALLSSHVTQPSTHPRSFVVSYSFHSPLPPLLAPPSMRRILLLCIIFDLYFLLFRSSNCHIADSSITSISIH